MAVLMSAPVGADVESICSKCGDVWHVVVAKVGDKIVKVQCKECKREHRHKPPGGPPPRTAASKSAKPRAPRAGASASGGARASRPAAAEPQPLVAADLSRPTRPYRASESFTPGDRIAHPTFGTGIVEASPGPGKIQVYFHGGPDGRRVLAQAKPSSSLSPPPPGPRGSGGNHGPPPF